MGFRNPFPPRLPVDPTLHGTRLVTDPAQASITLAQAKADLSTARILLRRVAKAQDRLGRKGTRDHALVLMDSCDDLADAMDREGS